MKHPLLNVSVLYLLFTLNYYTCEIHEGNIIINILCPTEDDEA